MNKQGIENRFRLMKIEQLIKFVIILLFLSSNAVAADAQSAAKSTGKNTAKYQGTISGKWSGEFKRNAISGPFSLTISADSTVSGIVTGELSLTITGTVSASGNINAEDSAGTVDWIGQLSFVDGRLSGSGTWTRGGYTGQWSSD